jgi:hypothetical protein
MNPPLLSCRVTRNKIHAGTGILTRCPSPTLVRLGLGPTNPGLIIMAQETLLFRWAGFSPALGLLIPAFSLDNAPHHLTVMLRCDINAPLPRISLTLPNIFILT